MTVTFHSGINLPLEMHKVRIIQKLTLLPVEQRLEAIKGAGYNTFLLQNKDVFLDMLTDSGVNAMSDRQQSAMFIADDAYAGSATFTRLAAKLHEIFGMDYFLPAHQGRAAENIITETLVTPGSIVAMNYHFTTTKAHINRRGGSVVELIADKGLEVNSTDPFKGDLDIAKLEALAERPEPMAFVRLEAGTNLIGGQPVSLENMRQVRAVCDANGWLLVLDASLLADNLYFLTTRDPDCAGMSLPEIMRTVADLMDVIYFSARKLGYGRGGGICIRDKGLHDKMRTLVPFYEGFLTYGGMSVREMEAITVGLDETLDFDMINQGPQFIEHMVRRLGESGVPTITPAGGLGAHVNARAFFDHIDQHEYPAAALAASTYIASGVRGMERGTMSEERRPDGSEPLADLELLRLALPRRVFTLSQVEYAVDRIAWLYENRRLVGGLRFVEEPPVLRFFYGRLEPVSDWPDQLAARFREDFPDSL